MTADIELLPLPEWAACDETVADMSTADVREAMADYARANMEPMKAEIEALRAERDLFRDETIELVRQNGEWQARAERLAEMLRKCIDYLPDRGVPGIQKDKARALLRELEEGRG